MQNMLTEKGKTIILNTVGNPVLTNCYLFRHELMEKIRTQEIDCFCYEGIVILIHPSGGIHKMYYFLENPDILVPQLVGKIREDMEEYRDLVGSVVDRTPKKNVSVLERLEFRPYKEYMRKQMPAGAMDWYEPAQAAEIAGTGDMDGIYQLLYGTFDVMSDHLVSRQELSAFLESSRVLKVSINGELAGVLLFESVGKKSYLRSLCVNGKYRGRKVGSSLLGDYIGRNQKKIKLFYLWVEAANERAIRLYEGFGYKDDGLREYVYLY